tara:strand:- start:5189 stop:5467 length:279 start_codon:yes stop_codon:yes gene_type:complete
MGNKKKLQWNSVQRSGINPYTYISEAQLETKLCVFDDGDLVTTLLGEIGIIIGYGTHPDGVPSEYDQSAYYKVLINNNVYNYLPAALEKVKK